MSPAAEVRELLPRFAGELDQPSADGLNTWMISRAAARDVKGVLSGLGGDEWFSGYPVTRRMAHLATTFSGRVQSAAGQVAGQFAGFVPGGPTATARRESGFAAQRNCPVVARAHGLSPRRGAANGWHRWWRRRDGNGRGARTGWRLDARDHGRPGVPARYAGVHGQPVAARFGRHEHGPFARAARAVRRPGNGRVFADVVPTSTSFVPTAATRRHYEGSGAKRVLIHALRDVLPPDIATRQKKGFALPFEPWMNGELADLVRDTCSREAIARRGLLNPDAVGSVPGRSTVAAAWPIRERGR